MEDPKVTIRFEFTNEFGGHYIQESTINTYSDYNEIDVIGEQLNIFLKQIGYIRTGDKVLMESLTDEEEDYLLGCLVDFRESGANKDVKTD